MKLDVILNKFYVYRIYRIMVNLSKISWKITKFLYKVKRFYIWCDKLLNINKFYSFIYRIFELAIKLIVLYWI